MLRKRTLPPGVAEATRDRLGREVVLHKGAIKHIARRHPEMDGCELAIMTAIENATIRCRGKKEGRYVKGREILYAQNLGPGAWLAVVVAFTKRKGEVITAFADKRGPNDKDRL